MMGTDVLNVLRTRSKSVYVCGDYNIDLLKIGSNNDYCSFYENVFYLQVLLLKLHQIIRCIFVF